MKLTQLSPLAPLLLGAAAACGLGNVSGDLEASRTGDLSNAPAERADGGAALAQACARAGAPPADYPTARAPYLQRLTDRSVRLMWASPAEPPPYVVVTTPDGAPVAEVGAEHDDGALPAGGGALPWAAEVGGLAAGSVYCYELRAGGAASARYGFRTAPAAGAGRPVRFVAFGDSGKGTADQRALLAQVRTVPFDFVVHTGDLAYDHGERGEIERHVFDVYAGVFSQFAFFPASGNHEYDTDDAAPFREAFALPENGGPEGLERWYSFDWGDAHFVALDTERTGAAQAAWLEADLAANRRPWTIVYGHRPPFSSGEHGSDDAFRRHFVPALERHGVQLVLSGHDHHYERSKPQNGVTYVVTGGGGIGTRSMDGSGFTAFGDAVIHFVYVTVAGDELALHAIDGVGNEFDSLVLRR
ncbi:MAG TPA: metallophosphoesterase [Polyangiaceae bacterium]|nr:metallophosphoesterase [Polyangiaceae bacterium]